MQKIYYHFPTFLLLLLPFFAFPQSDLSQKVPLDPRVKIGTLENGLVYYVQQNPKPENKVELRLVVNAGSVLENEDQRGLAHFTEHMAFNGSENFEKNELISYLQSIGVSFGADLNAYTGFDETVYILPIPSDDEEKLRSGFQVLRDWAGGLSLREEDIDAERSIILEEWRTGQGYSQRTRDQYLPTLLYQSQYAQRLPIGDMDIVQNFEYETLREFYRDWYRPNNMAVIAVGDADSAELEKLIIAYFDDLKNPDNNPERRSFEVPDHEETFVSVVTDEEAPGIQIQLFYKHLPLPFQTKADYKAYLIRTMYAGMLTQRLDEIRQQPNAPFIFAGTGYGNFVRSMDYFTASGVVSPEKVKEGIFSLIVENKRVATHGFTQPELDRVKRALLNSAGRSFKEMDKTESRAIVGRYVNHFLKGNFAEGEQWKYEFYQEIFPEISLSDINALADELITEHNRVIIITAPEEEKDKLPSEKEVLELFEKASHVDLEPYDEKELGENLISNPPSPVSILDQKEVESVGIYEFDLANGAKVFVKPTDFKNDEIVFTITGKGGVSIYPDEDHYSASYAGVMVNVMGVGDFSPSDLRKFLAGKTVSVTPNIGTYDQNISGSFSPNQAETALQLIHLYFTNPREDKELFDIYINNQKTQLASAQANPDYQLSKQLNKIIANGNKRALGIFDPEELDMISVDRGMEIFRESFSNAADFEFYFSGNIELESFIPLMETYLATLPAEPDNLKTFEDLGIRPPRGRAEVIEIGTDEKSQVILFFSSETSYSRDRARDITYLGEILTIKLIESLREEIGGVYGVGARGSMVNKPVDQFTFSVSFPCSPDRVDELIAAVWKEIKKIQDHGPEETDLQKVKEKRKIALEENLKRNNYWVAQMSAIREYGLDWEIVLRAKDRIDAISVDNIKDAAREFLTEENLLEIRKYPKRILESGNGAEIP
jgi:zinc protease